jgi:Uncharacterized conserved protein
MKQKFLSWGDDFTIQDDQERDVFFVDGKAFSIGAKLSFQDMSGNELLFIRQKVLSWGPTYEIYRGGVQVAVVKKELFTLFHCTFTVDVPGPDDWTDTYGVEVNEGEDDVLMLASAVVVDLACHENRRGR